MLAAASEIPRLVNSGQAHAGITGLDLVLESAHEVQATRQRIVYEDLGFGAARLVVGVPKSWIDVSSMRDLAEVAADFRHAHNRNLRVATKFPNLTRAHFRSAGLADYRIVESLGATEGAPRVGTADLVVDLSSTGATFESNGLKEVRGGLVVASQACLIACTDRSAWTKSAKQLLEHIVGMIEASLSAQNTRTLEARLDPGLTSRNLKEVEGLLIDAQWSGVSRFDDDSRPGDAGGVRLRALVATSELNRVIRLLRELGSQALIVGEPKLVLDRRQDHAARFLLSLEHDQRSGSPSDCTEPGVRS